MREALGGMSLLVVCKLYQINEEFTTAEVSILEAFSVFPASPSKGLCVDWLHEDAGIDEDKCALLLNKLAEQTWLEKRCGSSGNDVYFLMHQLVRTAVQEQFKVTTVFHQHLVKNCSLSLGNSTLRYKFYISASIIPFALSIYNRTTVDQEPFSDLAFTIATYFLESADFCSALKWCNTTKQLYENMYGEDHPATAALYNNLAYIYDRQGDYNMALLWYTRATDIYEKTYGKESVEIAPLLNNTAALYLRLGNTDKAFELYSVVLAVYGKISVLDNPTVANAYNGLAKVF